MSEKIQFNPAGNWKTEHDTYLQELFRKGKYKDGIDPTNLQRKYIEGTVIPRFFPGRKPESFCPLYRRKARKWTLEKTITGKRSK